MTGSIFRKLAMEYIRSPSFLCGDVRMRRIPSTLWVLACTGSLVACTHEVPTTTRTPGAPSFSAVSNGASINVVNVSRDTTAQNETPLAVNPANPANMITGNNDRSEEHTSELQSRFD